MKYLLILLIFTGCMTPKKAVDVLSRPKNEPVLAELCSTRFPVKDSIIKGDSVIRYDTLWGLVTDTLISEPQVIIETKIVPKTVTKWVTIRDTIVRENTAKVSVLNSKIAKSARDIRNLTELTHELTQQRDGYKSERNKWKLRFFLLLGIFGLIYAAKVKMTKKLF